MRSAGWLKRAKQACAFFVKPLYLHAIKSDQIVLCVIEHLLASFFKPPTKGNFVV